MIKYPMPNADVVSFPEAFTEDESASYFQRLRSDLDWRQDHIRLLGRTVPIPRMQAWYGDSDYTYSNLLMPARPMPDVLDELRLRAEEMTGFKYNSALCNLYRHGKDSLSWHADDEPELGENPAIASLSFGDARDFQFKPKSKDKLPFTIKLEAGTLFMMKGETQHYWLHQIPKTNKPVGERICLTFRMTYTNGQ